MPDHPRAQTGGRGSSVQSEVQRRCKAKQADLLQQLVCVSQPQPRSLPPVKGAGARSGGVVRIPGVRMTKHGAAMGAGRRPLPPPIWKTPPPLKEPVLSPASQRRRAFAHRLRSEADTSQDQQPVDVSNRRHKLDALPTKEAVIQQWVQLKVQQEQKDAAAGVVRSAEQEEEARLQRARERDLSRVDFDQTQDGDWGRGGGRKWKVISGAYLHKEPDPLSEVCGFLRVGEVFKEMDRWPPASPVGGSGGASDHDDEDWDDCVRSQCRPASHDTPDWVLTRDGWVQSVDPRIKGASFLKPYQSPRPKDICNLMLTQLDVITMRLSDTLESLQPDRFRPPRDSGGGLQRSDSIDAILATGHVSDHELRALTRAKMIFLRRAHARHAAIADALGAEPLQRTTAAPGEPTREEMESGFSSKYDAIAEVLGVDEQSGGPRVPASVKSQRKPRRTIIAPPDMSGAAARQPSSPPDHGLKLAPPPT
eukprot:TRINITY_DN9182_c1_g1_i2.p1 TRINITY_DN9182_c1_g1~~TRINITY_DN9182_c1_g1_i2.p1  ORF type:complete len:479 (+),score=117.46 TRINITY_DN9182_c1_g1_i2:54-1490(+)